MPYGRGSAAARAPLEGWHQAISTMMYLCRPPQSGTGAQDTGGRRFGRFTVMREVERLGVEIAKRSWNGTRRQATIVQSCNACFFPLKPGIHPIDAPPLPAYAQSIPEV